MFGEFVLLVKRDILVPEEHDTSLYGGQQLHNGINEYISNLCHQQGKLIFLGICQLAELNTNELGSNVRGQIADMLYSSQQGLLFGISEKSTIRSRFELFHRRVRWPVREDLLCDSCVTGTHLSKCSANWQNESLEANSLKCRRLKDKANLSFRFKYSVLFWLTRVCGGEQRHW